MKTEREKLLSKVKRLAKSALKTQAEYEKIRDSLSEEERTRLDEMFGGVWLKGHEKEYEEMFSKKKK